MRGCEPDARPSHVAECRMTARWWGLFADKVVVAVQSAGTPVSEGTHRALAGLWDWRSAQAVSAFDLVALSTLMLPSVRMCSVGTAEAWLYSSSQTWFPISQAEMQWSPADFLGFSPPDTWAPDGGPPDIALTGLSCWKVPSLSCRAGPAWCWKSSCCRNGTKGMAYLLPKAGTPNGVQG